MAFIPVKALKMATSGATAVAALALAFPTGYVGKRQVQIYVTSADDAVVKLGGSSVEASATYTSSALPDGNILLAKAQYAPIITLDNGDTHASIIRPGGTDVVVHFILGSEG